MIFRLILLCYFLNGGIVFGNQCPSEPPYSLSLQNYFLPKDHFLQLKLINLFQNKKLFKSPKYLQKKGFKVMKRVHRDLMVISHSSIPDYLFKKFQDHIPLAVQLDNYLKRIQGANALREFIATQQLQHIVVPQKWLYELPEQFSDPLTGEKNFILIVEKMNICPGGKDSKGEVARRYRSIDKEILREICIVLNTFRGLDSMIHNLPFTYQNKIAFIDTEKWSEKRKGFLKNIIPFLNRERREYAFKVFQKLESIKPKFSYETSNQL